MRLNNASLPVAFNRISKQGNSINNSTVQQLNQQIASRMQQNAQAEKSERTEKMLDLKQMNNKSALDDGLTQSALIDRGLGVVQGIYTALHQSLKNSVDPWLDELDKIDQSNASLEYKEQAKSEIKEHLQEMTDTITGLYGGFLKGTAKMYNKATDGAFQEVIQPKDSTTQQTGFNLLDVSPQTLGLDHITESDDIRSLFANVLAKLESYGSTLSQVRSEFQKANNLDQHILEAVTSKVKSKELDAMDNVVSYKGLVDRKSFDQLFAQTIKLSKSSVSIHTQGIDITI
ncbi:MULTISPECIES: hypothetical protein [Paenibacillus]|uniref:M1-871 n=1 Tax=Paenibacillus polymyxa (strain SC2) TaxID=886882 RepID=E3EI51_PAEPS|nr:MULTISPECIES: hypothetical protein [Paenibacillus]ADO54719.1 M1-871 [Paenibacillus polymyxa SC2]AJE51064.1 hypothetical protein RE92_08280 [Paenibacillus polymyxa]AZH27967.1 hypothetical protein EGM68_03925 [Paenibacillus sp. M-152]QOH60545.1 hypothetical protein DI243_03580 [Paenibacillus polymyxa]WPQ57590.1 hypothetical protein SKN87_03805 [Paenibacillus polymyxa]